MNDEWKITTDFMEGFYETKSGPTKSAYFIEMVKEFIEKCDKRNIRMARAAIDGYEATFYFNSEDDFKSAVCQL